MRNCRSEIWNLRILIILIILGVSWAKYFFALEGACLVHPTVSTTNLAALWTTDDDCSSALSVGQSHALPIVNSHWQDREGGRKHCLAESDAEVWGWQSIFQKLQLCFHCSSTRQK